VTVEVLKIRDNRKVYGRNRRVVRDSGVKTRRLDANNQLNSKPYVYAE